MSDPTASDPWRRRYFLAQGARAIGVAIAIAGLVMAQRAGGTAQQIAAFAVLIGGIGLSFTLPRVVARRWRTPDR